MLQNEYYVMDRESNDNYPLFSWDQKRGRFGLGKPIGNREPIQLRLGEPIPQRFEWADYHKTPGPVVSPRIAGVLAAMDIYGVELVPAQVRNSKDPFSAAKDYWFVHVWNRIHCLDSDSSKLELYDDGTVFSIDRLVLREDTLARFELRKRLIFELAEKTAVLLVHQSIKEAIEAVNPVGVRFFSPTQWNSDVAFQ